MALLRDWRLDIFRPCRRVSCIERCDDRCYRRGCGVWIYDWREQAEAIARVLEYFLAQGAVFQGSDISKHRPLLHAALANSAAAVRLLLAMGCDPNVRDEEMRTSIMLAAGGPIIRLLLDEGANVHARSASGATALHHLIENEHAFWVCIDEAMSVLLDAGADVNAQNDVGNTPLSYASYACDEGWLWQGEEVVALLSEYGGQEGVCGKNAASEA